MLLPHAREICGELRSVSLLVFAMKDHALNARNRAVRVMDRWPFGCPIRARGVPTVPSAWLALSGEPRRSKMYDAILSRGMSAQQIQRSRPEILSAGGCGDAVSTISDGRALRRWSEGPSAPEYRKHRARVESLDTASSGRNSWRAMLQLDVIAKNGVPMGGPGCTCQVIECCNHGPLSRCFM
jgi:hypothetical protein